MSVKIKKNIFNWMKWFCFFFSQKKVNNNFQWDDSFYEEQSVEFEIQYIVEFLCKYLSFSLFVAQTKKRKIFEKQRNPEVLNI